MSILLRFAASVVPEALSKTHNGAERCRSANTHERPVYAKTERSLKVGCCGPHFNPIVVKHLRPARYDMEFPLCGSYGLRADRRAEDVPGGDMKSRLIAVGIHKRFIYGRFNSSRLSTVICGRVHAASRCPTWYAPRILE